MSLDITDPETSGSSKQVTFQKEATKNSAASSLKTKGKGQTGLEVKRVDHPTKATPQIHHIVDELKSEKSQVEYLKSVVLDSKKKVDSLKNDVEQFTATFLGHYEQ